MRRDLTIDALMIAFNEDGEPIVSYREVGRAHQEEAERTYRYGENIIAVIAGNELTLEPNKHTGGWSPRIPA